MPELLILQGLKVVRSSARSLKKSLRNDKKLFVETSLPAGRLQIYQERTIPFAQLAPILLQSAVKFGGKDAVILKLAISQMHGLCTSIP